GRPARRGGKNVSKTPQRGVRGRSPLKKIVGGAAAPPNRGVSGGLAPLTFRFLVNRSKRQGAAPPEPPAIATSLCPRRHGRACAGGRRLSSWRRPSRRAPPRRAPKGAARRPSSPCPTRRTPSRRATRTASPS